MGTSGHQGRLEGAMRAWDRWIYAGSITPALTRTKANRVPKDVRSPAILPGTKAAKRPTNRKRIMFDL